MSAFLHFYFQVSFYRDFGHFCVCIFYAEGSLAGIFVFSWFFMYRRLLDCLKKFIFCWDQNVQTNLDVESNNF